MCALEKEMATHSSTLAWRIPGTEEPGGLPSMGSHRVGHDWRDLAATAARLSNTGLKPSVRRSWKSGVGLHQQSGGLVGGRNTQQVTRASAIRSRGWSRPALPGPVPQSSRVAGSRALAVASWGEGGGLSRWNRGLEEGKFCSQCLSVNGESEAQRDLGASKTRD